MITNVEKFKIFSEQGKFIDINAALDENRYIVEKNLISIKQNSKFYKKFYEEIYPVCYLAKCLGAKDIRLTNDTKEHLSYDAVVRFEDGREQFVECTTAIDGHQDALRNEHLKKYGYAPSRARINFEGTNKNREIHPTKRFFFMLENSVRYEILNNIEKVFISKQEKNRATYKDSILLIVVDCDGTNILKLRRFIEEECQDIFENKQPFKDIFLIHKNPDKYQDLFMSA